MVKDAEANKEADEKRRKLADTKNEAEQLINATEKAIKDLGEKVDAKDKEKAENLIKELKEVMEKDDVDEITKKKDELNEVAMALATKVYEEAAKANQASGGNANEATENENKKDDNIKDAEFEEK